MDKDYTSKKIVSTLTARVDRLPVMILPISIVLALAFGYFIALYDVIDVRNSILFHVVEVHRLNIR